MKWKELLTPREIAFIAVMVLLSVIFTNKWAILLLNNLNPFLGFVVYYVIVYSALILMSYLGLTAFGVKIKGIGQIIGTSLVLFSFFLIFNWENSYVSYVTTGSTTGVPAIFLGTEDGLVTWLFEKLINPITTTRVFFWWFLSFPVTIFILTLIAMLLTRKKPKISV